MFPKTSPPDLVRGLWVVLALQATLALGYSLLRLGRWGQLDQWASAAGTNASRHGPMLASRLTTPDFERIAWAIPLTALGLALTAAVFAGWGRPIGAFGLLVAEIGFIFLAWMSVPWLTLTLSGIAATLWSRPSVRNFYAVNRRGDASLPSSPAYLQSE